MEEKHTIPLNFTVKDRKDNPVSSFETKTEAMSSANLLAWQKGEDFTVHDNSNPSDSLVYFIKGSK